MENNKKGLNNQLLLNLLVMLSKANQLIVGLMDYNNNLELENEIFSPEQYKVIQEEISKVIADFFAKINDVENNRKETTSNETMGKDGTNESDV